MSGVAPNSRNINKVARATSTAVHLTVHPEYEYWRRDWQKLRDVLAGEREVKRKAQAYLPRTKGADDEDYQIYLERAVFYNMTSQTLNGMLGQVFRRDPMIRNLPAAFKDRVRRFAKDGTSIVAFTKTVMAEQIGMGRFGVLVDAPAVASRDAPASYAVGYTAENILDWTIDVIDDVYTPTRILLREFTRDNAEIVTPAPLTTAEARRLRREGRLTAAQMARPRPTARAADGYTYITYYRELILEPDGEGGRRYVQYLYKDDPTGTPIDVSVPVIRGKPLNFIPFVFFGASSNAPDTEKSPMLDIANLNLSHYRTYAELEFGRMYTALPVYYAPGSDGDGASAYHIGPNVVWEVPMGAEPGILEYTGQGLKALETALADKERQIAAIGGRLMPGASKSVSESDNQTTLREANEQALLLNVIQACEAGMLQVVRWWLMWRDVSMERTEKLRYEINQDFLSAQIGAREIRAVQQLYNDGLIPVTVLYEFYRKAEIIGSEITQEEFIEQLNDPNSFVNNPDAQARQRGFADRKQELDQVWIAREADRDDQQLELDLRAQDLEEEKLEIARKVGSTSVSASRKLGDPEQAPPAIADIQRAQPQTPPGASDG